MGGYVCVFICIYAYLCVYIVMCDYLCLFLINVYVCDDNIFLLYA